MRITSVNGEPLNSDNMDSVQLLEGAKDNQQKLDVIDAMAGRSAGHWFWVVFWCLVFFPIAIYLVVAATMQERKMDTLRSKYSSGAESIGINWKGGTRGVYKVPAGTTAKLDFILG